MRKEQKTKEAMVFIDGQNLYHCAKTAFGYSYPNFDVSALSKKICSDKGWTLKQIRFYTGVPDAADNAFWHTFWSKKLAHLGRTSVYVFSRALRYRNQTATLPDGTTHTVLVGEEKGVDVRIALDVIRFAHRKVYDVALILSQDQDLSEVVDEVQLMAKEQSRSIQVFSAFPTSPTAKNRRGINGTEWIPIDRKLYDSCLDPRDYRPKEDRAEEKQEATARLPVPAKAQTPVRRRQPQRQRKPQQKQQQKTQKKTQPQQQRSRRRGGGQKQQVKKPAQQQQRRRQPQKFTQRSHGDTPSHLRVTDH